MNVTAESAKYFLFAALTGAVLTYGALKWSADDSLQRTQMMSLENKVLDLEFALAQKEQELKRARAFAFGFETQQFSDAKKTAEQASNVAADLQSESIDQTAEINAQAIDNNQKVKALSTISDRDPRPFSEKVNEFLAINPGNESIAIASKSVFDLAESPESLPDDALVSLYQQQTNPDLKRVVAQVLSNRGDNSLIEKQISEAQTGLKNTSAAERQKALVELAKTHHASAASVIAPLLQDSDTGVKLDALLALRATGNQSHVHLVEGLANHPDPSVSWLANDVIASLENLSEKARTRIASADIVAELPVMPTP